MLKQIKLQLSHGRLSDREPFIVAENEQLELEFISDYKLDDLLVIVQDSEKEKQYRVSGNNFVVEQAFYKTGVLYIEVHLLIRGESVKTWTVEPIIIKKIASGFVGLAELEQLKQEIESLSARLLDLENKHRPVL